MTDDPRTRGDRPGLRWTVSAAIAGVLAILALNNPTEADARRFIAERVNESIRAARERKSDAQLADAAPALALLTGMLDSTFTVQRRNLLIASQYTIKPSALLETLNTAAGNSDPLGEICLLGVFGTFLPCGAKGAIAERLMRDGQGSSADGAATVGAPSDAVPPPPAPAPTGDTADLETDLEDAEPPPVYDDVAAELLAIGVRIRAGDLAVAERRLSSLASRSISPEDQVIVTDLTNRLDAERRRLAAAAAAPGSANAPRSGDDGKQRVQPRIDVRRSPSTDDFYPPDARAAEIGGVTTVSACVGPDGRVVGDPTVANSSGTTSIDSAAVRWARQAVFTPGTVDGVPAEICLQFRLRFKLTD